MEFTVFSKDLLQPKAYDEHLKNYLKDYLQLDEYDIEEEEFGIIPMTDHPLPPNVDKAKRIRRIGIKGGQCKAFLRLYFLSNTAGF